MLLKPNLLRALQSLYHIVIIMFISVLSEGYIIWMLIMPLDTIEIGQ